MSGYVDVFSPQSHSSVNFPLIVLPGFPDFYAHCWLLMMMWDMFCSRLGIQKTFTRRDESSAERLNSERLFENPAKFNLFTIYIRDKVQANQEALNAWIVCSYQVIGSSYKYYTWHKQKAWLENNYLGFREAVAHRQCLWKQERQEVIEAEEEAWDTL